MSLVRIVRLACDHHACWAVYQAEPDDVTSAADQRAKAARLGWLRSGHRDICPAHRAPFRYRDDRRREVPQDPYARATEEARRRLRFMPDHRRAELEGVVAVAYERAEEIVAGRRDPYGGI